MNIYELYARQVGQRPDAAALVNWKQGRAHTVSFRDLDTASARAVSMLAAAGLRAGDPALVFVPMSVDLYVALLAILRLGLVAVFIDPSAGRNHIERCCAVLPPKALIATPQAHLLRCLSPALRRIPVRFATGSVPLPGARRWSDWRHHACDGQAAECTPETPALVTFTSGSTGEPKAVVRSHGLLAAQQQILSAELKTSPADLVLSGLPIFVLSNLGSGAAGLLPGCDLHHPGSIDPEPIVERIRELGVTCIQASPAFLERVVDHCLCKNMSLPGIRRIYTGGAPVFPRLLDRIQTAVPQAEITAIYGSTEAEPIACISRPDLRPADRVAMNSGRGLLAGQPIRHIELRILPDCWGTPIGPFSASEFDDLCLGPGKAGEIVVCGPHVVQGYLRGEGDRAIKFSVAGRIWHRTGDAGRVDEEGNLWLLGRCAAAISDRQGVLYPFTVETAAASYAAVRRAACVQANGSRVLVVEPVTRSGSRRWADLKSSLAWANIERILVVPRIPVDRRHNAKVDYPALARLIQKRIDQPLRYVLNHARQRAQASLAAFSR
jgi:acyl-CoA synthetase (AMP-forming)/AMP-acid ligase II